MASPSGTSSGSSSLLQNSTSEEDLHQLMNQKKMKRKKSNQESARRSRMKKQKHLEDLTAEVAQLRKKNSMIITNISVTTQQYLNFEAENLILSAQVIELSDRLESLNEIITFLNATSNGYFPTEGPSSTEFTDGFMNNPLNYLYLNQPIMASADMLLY